MHGAILGHVHAKSMRTGTTGVPAGRTGRERVRPQPVRLCRDAQAPGRSFRPSYSPLVTMRLALRPMNTSFSNPELFPGWPMAEPTLRIWRDPRVWAAVATVFLVSGGLATLQNHTAQAALGRPFPWEASFAGHFPYWVAKLGMFVGVVWAAQRAPLTTVRWKRNLLIHFGFSFAYAIVSILLGTMGAHLLYSWIGGQMAFMEGLRTVYLTHTLQSIWYYWASTGVVHAVNFYVTLRQRDREAAQAEVRAARLETSLERARLDWLRSQLNPHFLFNTLNSISSLARQHRTETVVATLARLGDLLRATLGHSSSMVPLESELELLEKYLDIERLRFGDRLTISMEIDPDARSASVPSLILQPLVENALKHGLGGRLGPVSVVISASAEGRKTLILEVRDSGYGFREGWEEGIGLSNTRSRLAQLYGDRAELAVLHRARGAIVRISLPRTLAGAEPGPNRRGGAELTPATEIHSAEGAS